MKKECKCEHCGRVFKTPGALGSHRDSYACHAAAAAKTLQFQALDHIANAFPKTVKRRWFFDNGGGLDLGIRLLFGSAPNTVIVCAYDDDIVEVYSGEVEIEKKFRLADPDFFDKIVEYIKNTILAKAEKELQYMKTRITKVKKMSKQVAELTKLPEIK